MILRYLNNSEPLPAALILGKFPDLSRNQFICIWQNVDIATYHVGVL